MYALSYVTKTVNLVRPNLFWTNQNCFGHIEGQGSRVLSKFWHHLRKLKFKNAFSKKGHQFWYSSIPSCFDIKIDISNPNFKRGHQIGNTKIDKRGFTSFWQSQFHIWYPLFKATLTSISSLRNIWFLVKFKLVQTVEAETPQMSFWRKYIILYSQC